MHTGVAHRAMQPEVPAFFVLFLFFVFCFFLTGRLSLSYHTTRRCKPEKRWSSANMHSPPLTNSKRSNSTLGPKLHYNYKAVFPDSDGWLSAWNATCQAMLLRQMIGHIAVIKSGRTHFLAHLTCLRQLMFLHWQTSKQETIILEQEA